jgi:hypothetical protein
LGLLNGGRPNADDLLPFSRRGAGHESPRSDLARHHGTRQPRSWEFRIGKCANGNVATRIGVTMGCLTDAGRSPCPSEYPGEGGGGAELVSRTLLRSELEKEDEFTFLQAGEREFEVIFGNAFF